ncbi:hypothetical protein NEF87_001284 [Candidatus Lokiarchaeum ossiferum]|uniref:NADPH-dependent FMN reductase-like domain-containing protein n=1 Tax=Candidatus Lokiarchaeum ossiferum TaxID=2951803 RepID=A0ABY6HR86_9ARCH|nr:hypothetical protein NEF87_001284 [Candidatus Lokiarchaeum sp. B-35]
MKILSIIGSGRKNGNTALVSQLIEQQLSQDPTFDFDYEHLYINDYRILPCIGCRTCFNKIEMFCPLKDDFLQIKSKIDKATLIIFATPVYVNDVSALMKLLIDRLAFATHRPQYFAKYAFVVATTALSNPRNAIRSLASAINVWGFHLIGTQGLKLKVLPDEEKIQAKYNKTIQKITAKITKIIKSNRISSPTILKLAIFKVQQNYWKSQQKMLYEYNYWKSNGFFDSDRVYFSEVSPPKWKKGMAGLLAWIINSVFM